jgi:cytochrome bd-type quinol oxidase subunit 2
MTGLATRNVCRRITIELIAVVLLAGVPVDFPRGTSAHSAWSFLLRHPSLLAHVLLGIVILGEAVSFMIRAATSARSSPGRAPILLAALGAVFALVAVAGGAVYVSSGQHESSLTWMTAGWLGALVTFVIGWIRGRRALAAGTGARPA